MWPTWDLIAFHIYYRILLPKPDRTGSCGAQTFFVAKIGTFPATNFSWALPGYMTRSKAASAIQPIDSRFEIRNLGLRSTLQGKGWLSVILVLPLHGTRPLLLFLPKNTINIEKSSVSKDSAIRRRNWS